MQGGIRAISKTENQWGFYPNSLLKNTEPNVLHEIIKRHL